MNAKQRNIAKATKICDLYATDKYTIESCCESEGVNYTTFYCWITANRSGYIQEIQELYKKADIERTENRKRSLVERKLSIGEKALSALERKIEGWRWEEVTREGKDKESGKVIKVVNKFQVPDTASIIFSLTNAFGEEFKNKQNTDVTSGGKPIVDKVEVEIVRTQDVKDGNT